MVIKILSMWLFIFISTSTSASLSLPFFLLIQCKVNTRFSIFRVICKICILDLLSFSCIWWVNGVVFFHFDNSTKLIILFSLFNFLSYSLEVSKLIAKVPSCCHFPLPSGNANTTGKRSRYVLLLISFVVYCLESCAVNMFLAK